MTEGNSQQDDYSTWQGILDYTVVNTYTYMYVHYKDNNIFITSILLINI